LYLFSPVCQGKQEKLPHTPKNGHNPPMTEAELRKIAEYVDEIAHGLHEWDYRPPVGNPSPKKVISTV
jgi:hypothetical protein